MSIVRLHLVIKEVIKDVAIISLLEACMEDSWLDNH